MKRTVYILKGNNKNIIDFLEIRLPELAICWNGHDNAWMSTCHAYTFEYNNSEKYIVRIAFINNDYVAIEAFSDENKGADQDTMLKMNDILLQKFVDSFSEYAKSCGVVFEHSELDDVLQHNI